MSKDPFGDTLLSQSQRLSRPFMITSGTQPERMPLSLPSEKENTNEIEVVS